MRSSAARGMAPDRTRLSYLGVPLLGLLAVQFLLGMDLNLYVTLPTGSPGAILESNLVLLLHVAVAVLLLGLGANIVRVAIRAGVRRDVAVSLLGLASLAVAFAAGLWFAFGTGGNAASFAMSGGFVGAVLEAGYLLATFPGAAAGDPTPGSSAPAAEQE